MEPKRFTLGPWSGCSSWDCLCLPWNLGGSSFGRGVLPWVRRLILGGSGVLLCLRGPVVGHREVVIAASHCAAVKAFSKAYWSRRGSCWSCGCSLQCKKGYRFSRPQPGCRYPETARGPDYSRPWTVWVVKSRLGTRKSLTFFKVCGTFEVQSGKTI
jgi:hypothetical protein